MRGQLGPAMPGVRRPQYLSLSLLAVSDEDVDTRNPLSDYGVDSLMAVELRNWIRRDFKTIVAVFDLMGNNISLLSIGNMVAQSSDETLPN